MHKAQQSFDTYRKAQQIESEKLEIEMKQLQNGYSKVGLLAAEHGLESAKNNNAAFMAARAGVSAVKDFEGAVYTSLSNFASAAAGLCNITKISLKGTFLANDTEQKPFCIHIEATILGINHTMDPVYTPGKTDVFLHSLAKLAIEKVGLA